MSNCKRILLINNEPIITFFFTESLSELGQNYQVETCRHKVDAIFLSVGQPFDVVIIDTAMGHLRISNLITTLNQQSRETEYILLTSYGNRSAILQTDIFQHKTVHSLVKPFATEQLLSMVKQITTSSASGVDIESARTPPPLL